MLHEQAAQVLEIVSGWEALESLSPEEARALDDRRRLELGGHAQAVWSVETVQIPTPRGPIGARVYRGSEHTQGVLLWLHGGGWVVGSLEGSDDQARALANASGATVVAIDYALAPEHPFPQALTDCLASADWAHRHMSELAAEGSRLAIGGDSAGGNLAAAVCLMARDREMPIIDFQLLVYPVTCRELEAESRREFAHGYWLTLDDMEWFWRLYLPSDVKSGDPYASPLLAQSLERLPPALVIVAQCDVLRDEGIRYADRLSRAGVEVALTQYDGMLHGFLACAGVVDAAWAAIDEAGSAVRRAVGDLATRGS